MSELKRYYNISILNSKWPNTTNEIYNYMTANKGTEGNQYYTCYICAVLLNVIC